MKMEREKVFAYFFFVGGGGGKEALAWRGVVWPRGGASLGERKR